jgi:ABC-type dipeptide/oligopeptide/nickel transport system permease component
MRRYLLGRVLQTLLSMLVVISIVFVLTRLSGNPIHLLLDVNATERDQEILTRYLGLDRPLPVQYAIYVKNLARATSASPSSRGVRSSSTSGNACPPPSSWDSSRCSSAS